MFPTVCIEPQIMRCTKLYPNRCSSHYHSLSFSSPGLNARAKTRSLRLSTLTSTHAKPRGWIICSRPSHQRSRKVEHECCLHMLSTIGDFAPALGGCLIYRLHHSYAGTDLHMDTLPESYECLSVEPFRPATVCGEHCSISLLHDSMLLEASHPTPRPELTDMAA